ncbi:TetR/AcrR family transcriptional regulator C-terminal domain-containing protein [Streptomyces griseoruber]|uniref:TetR/AcrR family transcriptional regulator C-terminal domain-containing protein n=1 Tax=Streptomyces griseoruber TaxID=1943 RepID=UPI00378D6FC4
MTGFDDRQGPILRTERGPRWRTWSTSGSRPTSRPAEPRPGRGRDRGPGRFEEEAGTPGRLHPLQRPKSGKLLDYARPGDTVHISEMFRLVRGTGHILDVLDILHRDRLALRIHDGAFSGMDLTARHPRTGELLSTVKFMVQTLAAAGELQRELTYDGLRAAKAEAGKGGRRPAVAAAKTEDVRTGHLEADAIRSEDAPVGITPGRIVPVDTFRCVEGLRQRIATTMSDIFSMAPCVYVDDHLKHPPRTSARPCTPAPRQALHGRSHHPIGKPPLRGWTRQRAHPRDTADRQRRPGDCASLITDTMTPKLAGLLTTQVQRTTTDGGCYLASEIQPVPGSPAWWANRAPELAHQRGRPQTDVGRIVDAALKLIDDIGIQALTLRTLAETLESGTATLYRRINSKDELLILVAERIQGEVRVTPDNLEDLPWREGVAVAANALYHTLRRHSHAIPLLAGQIPIGPHGLRARERLGGLFLVHGFTVPLAARAFTAISHHVIGFAIQQHAPGTPNPDDQMQQRDCFHSLGPAIHPSTTAAADELTSVPVHEEFRFGLDLLLDGLEQAARRQPRRSAEPERRPPGHVPGCPAETDPADLGGPPPPGCPACCAPQARPACPLLHKRLRCIRKESA